MKRTVERRMAQQKRELSLAVVLSFTVLMFLITHLPRCGFLQPNLIQNVAQAYLYKLSKSKSSHFYIRVMTSVYEAVTIRSVIQCHKRKRGYLRIWYLYALSTIQFLQVQLINGALKCNMMLFSILIIVCLNSLNFPIRGKINRAERKRTLAIAIMRLDEQKFQN